MTNSAKAGSVREAMQLALSGNALLMQLNAKVLAASKGVCDVQFDCEAASRCVRS